MNAARPWHQQVERGSAAGMRFTAWLYRRLGRRTASVLVLPIVAYFFSTDAAARRASREYLRRVAAAPGGAAVVGTDPGIAQVFRHFLTFGLSIFDRVGFWIGRRADFQLDVRGAEYLDRVIHEGRGALVLGSHLGSFDAMRLLGSTAPIPINVMMYTRHAARINGLFERLAALAEEPAAQVRVLPIQPGGVDHVMAARAALGRGEVVAILADRTPPSERHRASHVEFLGAPALIAQGPFRLAAALGVPVLQMVALRTGDAHYEIEVEWLADRIVLPRERRAALLDEACQAYASRLEALCLRTPYQWFNFFDFWDDAEGAERARG